MPAGAAEPRLFLAEVDADHDAVYEAQLGLLDEDERARLARLRLAAVRREALAARLLLRHALSACWPRPPQDWRYRRGIYGRPQVLDAPELSFSLSHCAGLVGCLVAPGGRVGLDLEPAERDTAELWNARTLAPQELAELWAQAPELRGQAFLRSWTLKEAYAKASGRGLRLPFDRIAFARDGDGVPHLQRAGAPSPAWRLWSFRLGPTHLGAIAVRRARVGQDAIAIETVAALPYRGAESGRVLRPADPF
ncbi:4'-phosphopantetheinyl transferase superfamily protein [Lysobacter sp. 5GHs7-4]|uniref:4'-phosphopantetheinyl transferase family protein n=1 Tax=Lysobacter sp. 5GHs7-4 TaxID=2904253 RepID=UPI001E5C4F07|nr:4'-phosphopantetheinyl transferase superfamily protein [Lysobacter sp. 5GHs7-4]UHQ22652.1 4'-phosphopantetheinyl transferase superfamily protein [Lysobacter sp. 5GHs7-4]